MKALLSLSVDFKNDKPVIYVGHERADHVIEDSDKDAIIAYLFLLPYKQELPREIKQKVYDGLNKIARKYCKE